ncbi:MAG: 4-hydroxy-3-methylbut-2-enyl diphosphate reductase [Bacteroidales bacterium]|nr:4-hydroxy-3-methylbut-2-enyl diphosphate reductase [Bacteroidales bacterium]
MRTIIEQQAGFCFGVVRAINSLEEQLQQSGKLYCLGDIVHNSMEVKRLEDKGLQTITLEEMKTLRNCKVMIRAHGEPPSTYELAKTNNITLIDATCPMVLKLQKDVLKGYQDIKKKNGQIVIFGKKGHAEVIGLCGQTENNAVVISKEEDIDKIDMTKPLHIFSQTTKNKEDYRNIISVIKSRHRTGDILVTDSICKKVSSRAEKIEEFAKSVDCVLFVSGKNSSNGLYLYNLCKRSNPNTFFITDTEDIDIEKVKQFNLVGISGATSTPMWLMKKVEQTICAAN